MMREDWETKTIQVDWHTKKRKKKEMEMIIKKIGIDKCTENIWFVQLISQATN